MTPAELRAALAALGLTQAEAARCIGVAGRTMRDWCAGKSAIPETVRRVLLVAIDRPKVMEWMKEKAETP